MTDTETGAERLVKALNDPYHLFTRPQVAYLMATAGRWGREAAEFDLAYAYELGRTAAHRELAELNMAAIRAGYDARAFSAAEHERSERQRAAREAAYGGEYLAPNPDDYRGGPVIEPGWGDEGEES